MADYEPRIAAALDRLVPPVLVEPTDWDELVREAGELPREGRAPLRVRGLIADRRRMIAIFAVTAAAALLLAIPAVAVKDGWWFLGGNAPSPTDAVAVVASGRSNGIGWTMTAYVSEDRGVCVALTPEVGQRDMGAGAGSCGAGVRGEPIFSRAAPERRGRHWIGYVYLSLGLFGFPDFVFGPAAEGVDRVDVILANGKALRTATIDAPDEFSAPLDFYIVEIPRGTSLTSVVARDRAGTVLERRRPRVPTPGELEAGD